MQTTISQTSSHGSFSWKKDAFDSEMLNMSVAKVLSFQPTSNHTNTLSEELITDLNKHHIEYAVYRVNARSFPIIHSLEKSGWLLIDGYIALDIKLKEEFPQNSEFIRIAKESDVPLLQSLARNSFLYNRYYNDSLIPKHQADEIYAQWIKNSVINRLADCILVWSEDQKIYGFITLKKDGDLVLIAVDKTKQGHKIGRYLVQAALNQCIKWKLNKATIETQMTNIPALRSFQSAGFRITDSLLTFRWTNK